MSLRRRTLTNSSGFTLLELMVATITSLALGAGGFMFFRSQVRSLTDQAAGLDAIEGARAALDYMSNEIRQAGANPMGTCSGCTSALSTSSSLSSTTVTIKSDINVNGTLDSSETITYAYDSTNKAITRQANGSSATTLIKNVPSGGLSFQYFDATGTATTTTADAVAVLITVKVQAARATTVTTVTLASRVALRNTSTVLVRIGGE